MYVSVACRVVHAVERDAGVAAAEPAPRRSTRAARSRGRSAPTPPARRCAARTISPHPVGRDDPAGEERVPERADVGRGRVDPAVAGAAHGQVEDVRPRRAVELEVAERGAPGKLVRAQERGVDAFPPARTRARARARGTAPRSPARRSAPARRSRRCSTRSARRARTWSGARRARRGTAPSSRARARGPASRSRSGRTRPPRRGSRRSPTGGRAAARRSPRRRSAAGRRRAPSARSSPSSSRPSSIRLTTASAVRPFAPLAIPKRVSSSFGIP